MARYFRVRSPPMTLHRQLCDYFSDWGAFDISHDISHILYIGICRPNRPLGQLGALSHRLPHACFRVFSFSLLIYCWLPLAHHFAEIFLRYYFDIFRWYDAFDISQWPRLSRHHVRQATPPCRYMMHFAYFHRRALMTAANVTMLCSETVTWYFSHLILYSFSYFDKALRFIIRQSLNGRRQRISTSFSILHRYYRYISYRSRFSFDIHYWAFSLLFDML